MLAMKWAALLSLPPLLYVVSGKDEALHEVLKVFVILFVGVFYAAVAMMGKALFHGATVWVMRSDESKRVRVYFAGGTKDWAASADRFTSHTSIWFMFAVVIIVLTWTLGAFYRSPMILRFPFRFFLLAVFLTFVLAFCKAIPMVDKGEALFDYVFFNVSIQAGLFLSVRTNRRTWNTP